MSRRPVFILLLVLLTSGCSSRNPEGKVTGKVTFKGNTLYSGTVVFVDAEGKRAYGPISNEGRYQIPRVLAGPVKIAVKNHSAGPPKGLHAKDSPGDRGQAVYTSSPDFPKRYEDPETSRLRYEVRKGEQEYNIELIP